jgi:two-component system, sensor histidine kinase and response regulator
VHDLGEKAKEYLQHVTQLLDNLLHWSLSQTGDIKISNKKTDLVKVAKGQVDLFDFLASQKDIRIIMETGGSPLWSMVDENMVSLVLRNLISNAIKYSHEKGEIHLSFEREKDAVVISIVDAGVGIPQELIEKLQGNTWSEPRRGTMNEKGAGLGLRLGKEFVEKMHGQLIIDSSVNKGTKVKVYLPLYEVVTQKEIA